MPEILSSTFKTATPLAELLLRCGYAVLCGLLIGYERERHDRPAGLRTYALTCLAAAMFMLIAIELMTAFGADTDRTRLDPIRVVEAVTAGVAFIAAGAIIQSRGKIHGLTTGAGLWLAGAIGLACGAGSLTLATIGTALALILLLPMRLLEKQIKDSDET